VRDPRRDVRRLTARTQPRDGVRVGVDRERLLETHDHIQEEISQGHDHGSTILAWTDRCAAREHDPSSSARPSALRPRSRQPAVSGRRTVAV
jgi:hypothetical protein